jgi:hypothetical protein
MTFDQDLPVEARTWVAGVLLFLLASGCAYDRDVPGSRLLAETDRGLILGSISFADNPSEYRLYYEPSVGGDLLGKAQQGGFVELVTRSDGSGDPELFALELPAGDYVFTAWRIVQQGYRVWPKEEFAIPFVVKPNRTTYVGNFDFQAIRTGRDSSGKRIARFDDLYQRDLERFRERYEDIDFGDVQVGIKQGASMSWEEDATEANRSFIVFFSF